MSDILGLLLLVAVLVYTLAFMVGSNTGLIPRPGKRRYERRPRAWWHALTWVPMGYALGQLVAGSGGPVTSVALGVLLAAIHRAVPRPFEIIAGGAGLLVAVARALQGSACRDPLGFEGLVLLLAFSLTGVIGYVTGLVLGRRPRMGHYLVSAVAVVELSLFVSSPTGGSLLSIASSQQIQAMLVMIVVIALGIGLAPRVTLPGIGAGVLLGEVALAGVPAACDRTGLISMAAAIAFAVARLALGRRATRILVGLR